MGAGKTTLLARLADLLAQEGRKVGLITNDQAPALVDTSFLQQGCAAGSVAEVSGSCFCCNFDGFQAAVQHLQAAVAAEIILAEPVGSCTDLSATIVQPLKQYAAETLAVAPLSVLVDPARLEHLLADKAGDLHPSAAYILEKQLEEADCIVINKRDLLPGEALAGLQRRAAARWPQAKVFAVSAQTGEGVGPWLAAVLASPTAGATLAEVDYDVYAEGEAVLGWLNVALELRGKGMACDALLADLLGRLGRRFEERQAAVGHVKAFVQAQGKLALGNLTGRQETLQLRGSTGVAETASLTVNARVAMPPEELKALVLSEIAAVCGGGIEMRETALRCLRPGRPQPTHRFTSVV